VQLPNLQTDLHVDMLHSVCLETLLTFELLLSKPLETVYTRVAFKTFREDCTHYGSCVVLARLFIEVGHGEFLKRLDCIAYETSLNCLQEVACTACLHVHLLAQPRDNAEPSNLTFCTLSYTESIIV
jgi:hypothetical protein